MPSPFVYGLFQTFRYIAKKISIKACKSVISKHFKSLNLQKKQNSDKIKEKGEQNGDNIQKSRKD